MHRIGVVSDSHNMSESMLRLAAKALGRERIEHLIHLGDGERDGKRLAQLLNVPLLAVAGNCDGDSYLPREITLSMDGIAILLCHGDRLRVKSSLLNLEYRARELGAKLALYGHSHQPNLEHKGELMLMNPGSLAVGQYAALGLYNGQAEVWLREIPLQGL